MPLNPLRPRLRNHSNAVAKIDLVIPAGDEIEVSEDVAAQLAVQRAPFSEVTADPEPEPETGDPEPAKPTPAAKKAPAKKATPKAGD